MIGIAVMCHRTEQFKRITHRTLRSGSVIQYKANRCCKRLSILIQPIPSVDISAVSPRFQRSCMVQGSHAKRWWPVKNHWQLICSMLQ